MDKEVNDFIEAWADDILDKIKESKKECLMDKEAKKELIIKNIKNMVQKSIMKEKHFGIFTVLDLMIIDIIENHTDKVLIRDPSEVMKVYSLDETAVLNFITKVIKRNTVQDISNILNLDYEESNIHCRHLCRLGYIEMRSEGMFVTQLLTDSLQYRFNSGNGRIKINVIEKEKRGVMEFIHNEINRLKFVSTWEDDIWDRILDLPIVNYCNTVISLPIDSEVKMFRNWGCYEETKRIKVMSPVCNTVFIYPKEGANDEGGNDR